MKRNLEYELNNIGSNEQHPEEGIKCKNYELCETILPKWWFECEGHYLCMMCHCKFGTWTNENAGIYRTGKGVLDITDDLQCPICLEIKRSVSLPNCEHTLCIKCFKRCYYGDDNREDEPKFPYPDVENEYDNDPNNPKWNIDYPLIQIYNEEWNEWDDKRAQKYEDEEHLRHCPLCRK